MRTRLNVLLPIFLIVIMVTSVAMPQFSNVDQQADDGKGRTLAVQLVENLQRADLTPIERAHAIGALKERYELSVRQIADKLGVSKSMVQRSLDILDLPDDLLNALREGASESKVLLLAKVTDQALRTKYLGDLDSVTRDQIQGLVKPKAKGAKAKRSVLSPEDMRIADEIQRALGMRVTMSRSNTSADDGKLVRQFYSDGDLQEVFRRLVSAT